MSTNYEEARALERAYRLLVAIGNGEYKLGPNGHSVTTLRKDALNAIRHYPLAAGDRWQTFTIETGELVDHAYAKGLRVGKTATEGGYIDEILAEQDYRAV